MISLFAFLFGIGLAVFIANKLFPPTYDTKILCYKHKWVYDEKGNMYCTECNNRPGVSDQ